MNPISHIFTSTYRVKWLKSKLTQTVKINIDENNLKTIVEYGGNQVFFSFAATGATKNLRRFGQSIKRVVREVKEDSGSKEHSVEKSA